MDFHRHTQAALKAGVHLEQVEALPVRVEIARMKELLPEGSKEAIQALMGRVGAGFVELGVDLESLPGMI